MELAQLMLLISFMGTCGVLCYTTINTFLKLFGIHCHEFGTNADPSQCTILMKYLKNTHLIASSTHASGMPIGFIFGKWFVAYVSTVSIQKRDSVYIGYIVSFWTTNKGHIYVFPKEQDDEVIKPIKNVKTQNLEVWRSNSTFKDGRSLVKHNIFVPHIPCEQQLLVIQKLLEMIKTSATNGYGFRLFVMIAGPSGTGKSHIARLFALAINATLADDFDPLQPGQTLTQLLEITKPTTKKPLVIPLEEFDRTIISIHKQEIKDHEFLATPIRDKTGWNTFADRLAETDNVIVIATMNASFKSIDELDSSYTRYGRVDVKVNFGGDDTYNPDDTKTGFFMHIKPFCNMAVITSAERFAPQKRDQNMDIICDYDHTAHTTNTTNTSITINIGCSETSANKAKKL